MIQEVKDKKKSINSRKKTYKNNFINSFLLLAPTDNISEKQGGTVFDALDFALNCKDVKNLAVTGPYGSGKSSYMNSFLANNRKIARKTIKVSLATFCSLKNSEESYQQLEESILQQIFFTRKARKFPLSKFSRIKSKSLFHKILLQLFLPLLIAYIFLFMLYLVNSTFFQLIKNDNLELDFLFELLSTCKSQKSFFINIFFISVLVISFFLVYELLRAPINRIMVKDVEIELDQKNRGSLLNKYLDELIYFFESTKYNYVIFEDVDRFEDTKIFLKLREMNTIINNYERIKQKRRNIIFIYLIRDDLFSGSDRTKFFDFIIPIMPVIDRTNSMDIIGDSRALQIQKVNERKPVIEMLFSDFLSKKKDPNLDIDSSMKRLLDSLSFPFRSGLSVYVNDIRLLQNCINEYYIYDGILKQQIDRENANVKTIKAECLFSIILYKNLYPVDFAKLQDQKGFLYSCLTGKQRLLETLSSETDKNFIKEKPLQYLVLDEKYKNEIVPEKNEDGIDRNLVLHLISGGYLSEDYTDYISRLYSGGLLDSDWQFVVNVKKFGKPDFVKELESKEEIFNRISSAEWNREAVLNYSLLNFLFKRKAEDEKFLEAQKFFCKAVYNYEKKTSKGTFSGWRRVY